MGGVGDCTGSVEHTPPSERDSTGRFCVSDAHFRSIFLLATAYCLQLVYELETRNKVILAFVISEAYKVTIS